MAELSMSPQTADRPSRWLERALLFTIAAHAAGMVSMVLLLLPGIPGGTCSDPGARAAYIADHPWLWRLGWLPWQLTAASDMVLGMALILTPWIRKGPAILAAVVTCSALVPDQWAQFRWTWEGVALARDVVRQGDLSAYVDFETTVFILTAGWGALGYTLGAVAWTWCFAASGLMPRWLMRLSIVTWCLFAATTVIIFVPESARQSPSLAAAVSIGNAAAFVLLMCWLLGVAEAVFRRGRPWTAYGSHARWRHPSTGWSVRAAEVLANSTVARALASLVPGATMKSDITDVVYVNYLVEAGALEPLVSRPLQLQRLGPDGGYAMFTFLTYRHGCFGPACFGPLRRFWPSPVQSNWRVYVAHPRTGRRGVQFLTTAISSTPHAIAARLLAEGVPMHVPASACLVRQEDQVEVVVDPGNGSAPDVRAALTSCAEPELVGAWKDCFGSWQEMLRYCVPQDRALSVQAGTGRVIRQEIDLGIRPEDCHPLEGSVDSRAARAIVGDASPLCFLVDRVAFRFLRGHVDRALNTR